MHSIPYIHPSMYIRYTITLYLDKHNDHFESKNEGNTFGYFILVN